MFVAHDQENLVHAHQTAAAAKSLVGGTRGLGAKTPTGKAPKTPFKVPLNDENAFKAGKSGLKTNGKGNENLFTTVKKGGELDKNAFITPAGTSSVAMVASYPLCTDNLPGPKQRAPLGMKTTNAKAKAFMTPGPAGLAPASIKTQQKSKSPRLRRPKVKILQEVETEQKVEDEEEPDIEYMPPRSKRRCNRSANRLKHSNKAQHYQSIQRTSLLISISPCSKVQISLEECMQSMAILRTRMG